MNAHVPLGRVPLPLKITSMVAAATALALSASGGNAATTSAGQQTGHGPAAGPPPRPCPVSGPSPQPRRTGSAGTGCSPAQGRIVANPAPRPIRPALPLSPAAPRGKRGATGLGDPYYPAAGNGGYDALDYDVALDYKRSRRIEATVTMTAKATQDLSGFSLDFRGPKVKDVLVNGRGAAFSRKGQELMITPAAGLPTGRTFTTQVRYAGSPGPLTNDRLGTYGWIPTREGVITVSEPDGTPSWMPVNDHPLDKATYTFRVTVPNGMQVIANGAPSTPVHEADTTTHTWSVRSPMASYLVMVAIGEFKELHGRAGDIPVITAVDPQYQSHAAKLHRNTITVTKWLTEKFGPYPFATSGGLIDDQRLGYALETQERPVYAGFVPSMNFVVHELAHQWFGNSVSIRRWSDIWLNEGLSTYAEWLWQEDRRRGNTAQKIFRRYYRQPADSVVFRPPPGRPGRRDLFGYSVYIRGAMTVHALRRRIGDEAFFRTLRAWNERYRYGNAQTDDFVALAEKESGKRLDRLFRVWLYTKGKPVNW
ncbi:Peptidase family M1 [Thermomonospora echinospora]|uniref:Aminopeptidase N n=1 Tax=Thermomonospora echinospora TaxID=1992 RepID=A0A1H6AD38_9ACTN|nr:M1 family metallopeptidase [Thermomonospora echinospora]SEG45955.1 Peptidase family M1 [Thermomonospora echinospora]